MTTSKETHAYIGIAPCGCVQGATVDGPDHKREVSKDVAGFLKWGTVERVSIENARVRLCFESHGKKGDTCPHPNGCPHRAMEPLP